MLHHALNLVAERGYMQAGGDKPIRVCAVLMGGSTAETISTVHAALEANGPVALTIVDLLMFHLRSPGQIAYPREAEIIRIGPADCGINTKFKSSSINLLLSGGAAAFRRIVDKARATYAAAKPDVVVLCHDRLYSELAFVRAAQEMGIPTVLIQEGPFCVIGYGTANSVNLKIKYLFAPLAHKIGLLPAMPDYGHAGHARICAASEAYAAQWVRSGIEPDHMAVTGIPRYDSLARIRHDIAAKEPRPGGVPRVCFLAQPFARHGKVSAAAAHARMRDLAEAFNRAAASTAFDLVVRAHPRGNREDLAPLVDALATPYEIQNATAPFPSVLPEFDLVVGFYSSAILEALACDVPAVCVRLPKEAFSEPAEGAKQDVITGIGVPTAIDAQGLADALVASLTQRPAISASKLRDEIGQIQGQASRMVADVISASANRI
ncbi:hypothetical protein [Xanthobacter sp. KR7-225]|uniref:hypothetical protein n=1 Tax=Xanthobacter sp. KR7-225 TaxID=3156613 RepID=UPI0032B31905